jgi:hypothetical protein
MELMKVLTKPCIHCKLPTVIMMTADQFARVQKGKELVQDIFPDWSPEDRELVISGTHNECWIKLFPPRDEEE